MAKKKAKATKKPSRTEAQKAAKKAKALADKVKAAQAEAAGEGPVEFYRVPTNLFQAVITYLEGRPLREIHNLYNRLLSESLKKDGKPIEVDNNLPG